MASFRWGIIGPGAIAKTFARGLADTHDGVLGAVAGRSIERSQEFAREYGAEMAYASPREMLDDPNINAVYVATPHPFHLDGVLAACAAGKAVLCEKPLTPSFAATRRAVEAAEKHGVFLAEAIFTRMVPAMAQALDWIAEGRIGEPRLVDASFGFRTGPDPESRLLAPALGGGGILDVGIYCIALCDWVFGQDPSDIRALGHVGETGVDEQSVITLRFPAGQLGIATSAVRTNTRHVATIYGTDGRVTLHEPWWRPTRATLEVSGDEQCFEHPLVKSPYSYEAEAVATAVRAGQRESPHFPWESSLRIARIMDEARRQIGVRYPFESETA